MADNIFTDEEMVQWAARLIIVGELGATDPTTTNPQQVNANTVENIARWGVGLLQWTHSRSWDFLHYLYVNLGNTWKTTTPPDSIKIPVETGVKWPSFVFEDHEITWVENWLGSDPEIGELHWKKMIEDLTLEYNYYKSIGITDQQTILYVMDFGNQYGMYSGYISNYSSLDQAYNSMALQYQPRRLNMRDMILRIWDGAEMPDVAGLNVAGAGTGQGPSIDEPNSDSSAAATAAAKGIYKGYIPIKGDHWSRKGISIKRSGHDLYLSIDLSKIDGNALDEAANNIKDENAEKENANNNQSPSSSDWEKIKEKILSVPLMSVEYTQTIGVVTGVPRNPLNLVATDCSGYVIQMFAEVGINLGTYTQTNYDISVAAGKLVGEWAMTDPTGDAVLKEGDIIMMGGGFGSYGAGNAAHVGIYMGNGKFRHQSSLVPETGVPSFGPFETDWPFYRSILVSNRWGGYAALRWF